MDYFIIEVSEEEIKREREKARELRKSPWWKNRLAKGACHWCGARFPVAELCMDHVVPVIRGGKSSRGNVVPSCKQCNNQKKHLLPIEWEEYLTAFTARAESAGPESASPESRRDSESRD